MGEGQQGWSDRRRIESASETKGFLPVALTRTGREVNGDKLRGKALTCLWLKGKFALRHTPMLSGQEGE